MRALLILFLSIAVVACKNSKEPSEKNTVVRDSTEPKKINRAVNVYAPVDVSPMDMSYLPVDYPKTKTNTTTPPIARVVYSRPYLQGRNLFNDILKYGEPWRLGANEATELHLYRDVKIQEKAVKAGRYIMYCIPDSTNWTIILNTNIDSWGLNPDTSKDLARFTIPVKQQTYSIEHFTMVFREKLPGAELVMAWDDVEAALPFTY